MNQKFDLRIWIICGVLFSVPFICNIPLFSSADVEKFHTKAELRTFRMMTDTLPTGGNSLFIASGKCQKCHGYDTLGIASVDPLGNDINVVDDWRATLMANSAKDPFWRAKVSHETFLYPQLSDEIETKCTSCHAPLGHFAAIHDGLDTYTIEDMEGDSVALDGVSCLACHQQSATGLGTQHSGNVIFDTAKVAYGPFISPLSSPMLVATGYEPVFSPHISDAGLCASCHTLVTETLDLDGNYTGTSFVEQATYHEWLNSRYQLEDISCQDCHFKKLSKGGYTLVTEAETQVRDSFFLHETVGANTTMLKILRNNIEALDLTATAEQFDEIISATEQLLKYQSVTADLELTNRTSDTAFFSFKIENLAGHKFPSGYPSRRAFVQFIVTNDNSDTLFYSGKMDEQFNLVNESDVEPHYNTINNQDQVQIYEFVMSDFNGDRTTVLGRGYSALKDNRLPPQGFSTTHAVYDTTLIFGNASTDPNFNLEDGVEGSGSDQINFHVPLNGNNEALEVTANIFYQSMPAKWMEEMFDISEDKINFFKSLYEEADLSPFLILKKELALDTYVSTNSIAVNSSWLRTEWMDKTTLMVNADLNYKFNMFDINGRLILKAAHGKGTNTIQLGHLSGLFILYFEAEDGRKYVLKAPINK